MQGKRKRTLALLLVTILLGSTICIGLLSPYAAAESYAVGDHVLFGAYPQTQVADSDLVAALNAQPAEWKSYGYYIGTGAAFDGQMAASDYMYYCDVVWRDNTYRGVRFTQYRPVLTGRKSYADISNQDENGYVPDTVYWFQYEPLEWRILDPHTGLVLCEKLIDSQPYNSFILEKDGEYWKDAQTSAYASDYAASDIRQWLNDDFYNTAFTNEQKQKIVSTTIQTPAYSADYSQYDSADTQDPVFLLSWSDALKTTYGFQSGYAAKDSARRTIGTDYAKCQGLNESAYNEGFYSQWFLRSAGKISYSAGTVNNEGKLINYAYANHTDCGIRPALILKSAINYKIAFDVNHDALPVNMFVFEASKGAASPVSGTYGGIAYAYDPESDIITLDGTVSMHGINARQLCLSVHPIVTEAGDYILSATKVGGSAEYTSALLVLEATNDDGQYPASGRKNLDFKLEDKPVASRKITFDADGEATELRFWCCCNLNGGASVTFDHAQYKLAMYKASEAVADELPAARYVSADSVYGTLPTVTRTGYSFDGWHVGSEDGALVTASSAVASAEDHTLVAAWKKNSYTVKWDVDGKTTTDAVLFGDAIPTIAEPQKKGYAFTGWSPAVPAAMPANDLTFTAQFRQLRVNGIAANDVSLLYKQTGTIAPTVTADDGAEYTLAYSGFDSRIVSVDTAGRVTPLRRGATTVTVTATDEHGNSVSDACTVTVNYTWWQWLIRIFLLGFLWY